MVRLMASTSWISLPAPSAVRQDLQQVALVTLPQVVLELDGAVEMVDDRALAAAGDHDHLLDAAGDGLLDAVLDGRLVDERQHLLGLGLGHGKESRAQAS